jgi:hypothetical protein
MSNITSTPTNDSYENFDFSKYINLMDLQHITNNIIDIISVNTLKENRSLRLIKLGTTDYQITLFELFEKTLV